MIDIEKVITEKVEYLIGSGNIDVIRQLIIAQTKVEYCRKYVPKKHVDGQFCLHCDHQTNLITNLVTQIERTEGIPEIDLQFAKWNAQAMYDLSESTYVMTN